MNQIKLLYGPFNIRDVWAHRPNRLFHLKEILNYLGFFVDLVPIQPRNRLILTLNTFEIFRCSLISIRYCHEIKADEILIKITWAALEARARFYAAKMNKELI